MIQPRILFCSLLLLLLLLFNPPESPLPVIAQCRTSIAALIQLKPPSCSYQALFYLDQKRIGNLLDDKDIWSPDSHNRPLHDSVGLLPSE
ncbi:hypothetical protein LX36DRAFT_31666 [Colletotrichum falcatum]|nr:hypothetical protein LX36DRAFT_31666 [Colletotrichum falcatum]